ncbi:MAG: polyketide synthase dehydratase domain-containing protein, partial [Cyanobacteria bacterium P01_C01_bin.147]
QVAHAFHSPLMEPMLAEFRQVAATVNYASPQMELISNVTGQVIDVANADYWVNHVRQPVQFATGMQTLANRGYNTFIELGAKPILLAMGRMCVPDLEALWLPSLRPDADWQTLFHSLGELYAAGASINWQAVDQTTPGQRVALPTYPFQRQRYWVDIEPTQLSPNPPISPSLHPLLGAPLDLPRTTTLHFESHLSPDSPDYLQDHQVFGATVLPAAGFMEMAIAALQHTEPDLALALASVTLHQALVLEQPKPVQVLLLPADDTLYRFEILSRTEADWVLHASGQIVSALPAATTADLAQLQSRCDEPVAVDACYQRLADQGVTYGDRFRAIEKIWKGNNEVLSQLQLPKVLHSTAVAYHLHPVLLDACLQSLAAVFLAHPDSGTYLPAGVAQVYCASGVDWAQANYQLWCHAQVQVGEREVTADIQLFLADGQLIGHLKELKLRPATPDRVIGSSQFQDWLYQIDWQAQALSNATLPAEFLLSPEAVCRYVAPAFEDALQQPAVETYRQRLSELETLSLAYVEQAIASFGDLPSTDDAAERAQAWGISPQQRSLFQYLLRKAESSRQQAAEKSSQVSVLSPQLGAKFKTQNSKLSPSPHPSISPSPHPNSPELPLLTRCGENLAAVLKGEVEPLTLLFPQGDLSDLTRLYEDSTGARVMNSLVQQVVAATITQP